MVDISSSTAQPAGKAEVSDNPLDYLSMIIYVKESVHVCEQIKYLVSNRMDILLQNVETIEQKPDWLTGVPTVVFLPSRQVLTGTRALNAVKDYCETSMQGIDGMQSVQGGTSHCTLVPQNNAPPVFNSLFSCHDNSEDISSRPSSDSNLCLSDPRYEDKPKEKQNERSLEDVMRRRGGAPRAREERPPSPRRRGPAGWCLGSS